LKSAGQNEATNLHDCFMIVTILANHR